VILFNRNNIYGFQLPDTVAVIESLGLSILPFFEEMVIWIDKTRIVG